LTTAVSHESVLRAVDPPTGPYGSRAVLCASWWSGGPGTADASDRVYVW